ncbi:MAG TPA: hypothetical protein VEA36_01940 [Candidatus Paceibacterota bacterium]|nr:hypothetical protein [Candidatus Paceibacterota bacterium]
MTDMTYDRPEKGEIRYTTEDEIRFVNCLAATKRREFYEYAKTMYDRDR